MPSSPLNNTQFVLAHTPESFSNFIQFADDYLDKHGAPVAFRRHFIADWCSRGNGDMWKGTPIRALMERGLRDVDQNVRRISGYSMLLHWYYDVYGELAYRAPFLSLLGRAGKTQFFEMRVGQELTKVLLPKCIANEQLINEEKHRIADEGTGLLGLYSLRNLPLNSWTQLAAAEYDASIAALFASRPSYHLSMWSSHQTAEKILKAVLLAHRWTEKRLADEVNHHLPVAAEKLADLGFPLNPQALSALKYLEKKCGPDIRYADYTGDRREVLRNQAWTAHQKLLEFAHQSSDVLHQAFICSRQDVSGHIVSENFRILTHRVFEEFLEWAANSESFSCGIGNEGLVEHSVSPTEFPSLIQVTKVSSYQTKN